MTGAHRILIVEDEPLIAMMLEDFLDVLGKQMAGIADSVADALALIEAGGIDAAILDVNLRGGEKSWPIAAALAARGVPFVLATGGSTDSIADGYRDRPTLPKPFTMDAVAKALDGL
ncbi:MAG: transcriptional regulator [Sphingomonas bacterium]|jgi:DNA-binding response OmpR family regulator|uniref:response regulator n=1 Tax=Sphingomonas bacterium TaxID=1895847 RepID=UPI002619E2D0|nr:response regulator [Sphingomonas bacterium]MDB5707380.1 transcriptional regulator [Sphingomonas bacterium]